MLERLFKSGAEVKVLGVILFEDGLHLREIARRSNLSSYETKRELDNLTEIGILNKEKKGNLALFFQNKDCPILKDLKNLYLKTVGIFEILERKLKKLEKIKYSFIFGSMGIGKFREKSDLDLMIIGDVNDDKISEEVFKIQKRYKREINFIHWTDKDFRKKIKEKSRFLENISKNKKWIMGDQNEFEQIIKE